MKKTVTANISGLSFTMDEDAYDALKSYYKEIDKRLTDSSTKDEIKSDIESRTAEILEEMGIGGIKVVSIENIRKIIEQIGAPSIFGEQPSEEAGSSENSNSTNNTNSSSDSFNPLLIHRKFMRDPQNMVLGGVCSGLALYFKMDISLMRIIVVLLSIFSTGIGFVAYLAMWVSIPHPTTAEDFEIMKRMRENSL